jgi:hypothetical protein
MTHHYITPEGKRHFTDVPHKGWRVMTPEEVEEADKPKPVVPHTVTMRQARLALLAVGLLDDVEDAIEAIPDLKTRRAAQIDWEYATDVRRDSPLIAQLGPNLGLTDAQIDELFIAASQA